MTEIPEECILTNMENEDSAILSGETQEHAVWATKLLFSGSYVQS